jgi:hypothetical protein
VRRNALIIVTTIVLLFAGAGVALAVDGWTDNEAKSTTENFEYFLNSYYSDDWTGTSSSFPADCTANQYPALHAGLMVDGRLYEGSGLTVTRTSSSEFSVSYNRSPSTTPVDIQTITVCLKTS